MNTKKATLGCNREVAHEKPDPTTTLDRNNPRRKFTRRRRGPYPHRSQRLLVRHGLLQTYVNIGSRP